MKYLNRKLILRLLTALPLIGLGAQTTLAAPKVGINRMGAAYLADLGKSAAAESARQAYGGKVLKVEEFKEGDKTLYRVKLLLDGGRVKIVTVDGDSGEVV